jgi:hypothetical protein
VTNFIISSKPSPGMNVKNVTKCSNITIGTLIFIVYQYFAKSSTKNFHHYAAVRWPAQILSANFARPSFKCY